MARQPRETGRAPAYPARALTVHPGKHWQFEENSAVHVCADAAVSLDPLHVSGLTASA